MRKGTWILAAMLLLTAVPAAAQTVTLDEVATKIALSDALVNDFTVDVIQNQGEPSELRGTAIFQKANRSHVTITEDGASSPLDRLLVTGSLIFSSLDNDAGTATNRDLPLDPSNSDLRTVQRIVATSPILHWRFDGGDTTAPVAGDNRYVLVAAGSNVDFRITVDTSMGVMVARELWLDATLVVAETWSGFTLVDGLAYLPAHYESDYLSGTEVTTMDYSNFLLNQNPDADLFRMP